ncbi:contractile injection system protein, VgrG/Pvc8 family [Chromobacterium haemolyticum]|uniref:contractile injection system protein, VgrG/Pvc8 family n=1 Tax=Chromobacterium haemolyticum TaxID=394935 RepID=UPI002449BD99|nr:contractile injection system protein, VgrG/Pvc8 family [Chromobacterium haemolyticum]MDH0342424.1 contractile injection system protein, VgrG/Pvc8 family [Chromobacterium haemolyticum]
MSFMEKIHSAYEKAMAAADVVGQLGQATGVAETVVDAVGTIAQAGVALGVSALSGKAGAAAVMPASVPVAVTVKVKGKPLKEASVLRVVTRLAVNEIPSAVVELGVPNAQHNDFVPLDGLLSACAVGQPVEVLANDKVIWSGLIGALQVSATEDERRVRLKLKTALQGLKIASRCRVFEKGTDQAVLAEVFKAHGVKASVEGMGGEREQRIQWNCPDWAFIRGLMSLHGAWLWPQADGTARVGPPKSTGKKHQISASAKDAVKGELGAQSVDWEFSGLALPKQVSLNGWDIAEQKCQSKEAKAPKLGGGGLDPSKIHSLAADKLAKWELASLAAMSASQLPAAASALLQAQQSQAVRMQIALEGIEPCALGDSAVLKGFGGVLSGDALISGVEHEFASSPRALTTRLWIGLDAESATPPELPVPAGLMVGKVAPFKADPKSGWNRLPVLVPQLGKGTLWARFASPYASVESGVCFYPEKDDEVILGFLGGEPVILGSVHNPKQKAPIAPSAANARKGVVLKHDKLAQSLLFDRAKHMAEWTVGAEKEPEQRIELNMNKGATIHSAKGDCKMEALKGTLDWNGKAGIGVRTNKAISLNATTGIDVKSEKSIDLSTLNFSVSAKDKVKLSCLETTLALSPVKAGLTAAQVAFQAKASMSIEGLNTTVKGQTMVSVEGLKAELKGTAQAEVSAGVVNVKGLVNLG